MSGQKDKPKLASSTWMQFRWSRSKVLIRKAQSGRVRFCPPSRSALGSDSVQAGMPSHPQVQSPSATSQSPELKFRVFRRADRETCFSPSVLATHPTPHHLFARLQPPWVSFYSSWHQMIPHPLQVCGWAAPSPGVIQVHHSGPSLNVTSSGSLSLLARLDVAPLPLAPTLSAASSQHSSGL